MNILRTCLRWSYRIFWYALVGLIISLAVAVSIVRIFPPDVEAYRSQVEEIASSALEQQVRIKSMDARLIGFIPHIIFNDVHMLDDTGKREIIRFERASLGLDLWRSLSGKKLVPKSLTIYGINLGITRKRDGTFLIQGLDLTKLEQQISTAPETVEPGTNELSEWLFERSELAIRNSTVVWVDRVRGTKTRHFEHVNFDIRNDENRHQLTGAVTLPGDLGRDIEVAFDIRGNILNPLEWQGAFYAKGKQLQISNWGVKPAYLDASLEKGMLDIEIWGDWKHGRIERVTADVATYDFELSFNKTTEPFRVARISGLFDWQRGEHDWLLNVSRFRYMGYSEIWPATDIIVRLDERDEKSPRINAYASYIRLSDVKRVLQEGGLLDNKTLDLINKLDPVGELQQLSLVYQKHEDQALRFYLNSRFRDLSVSAWQKLPGVRGVDGRILMNQSTGELQLENDFAVLDFPKLFRQPFEVTRLNGRVAWWHQNNAWHVSSENLLLATNDITSNMSVSAVIPDADVSPFMDLQLRYVNGDARQAWRYYPVSIMSKALVNWLDNGIVDGKVTQGNMIFNGRLADFPFRHHEGTFIAQFDGRDMELNYQKGWPNIKQIDLSARITGLGMNIQVDSGKIFDSNMKNVTVDIEKFSAPVLAIKGDIHGYTSDMVRYLVESPIAPAAANFYAQSRISGNSNGKLTLTIPLSNKVREYVSTHYDGYIDIDNSRLSSWDNLLEVRNASGRVTFSPRGVFSENLKGEVLGEEVDFSLYTREIAGKHETQLSMLGNMNTAELAKHLDLKFLRRISGRTKWQGVLSFGYATPQVTVPGSFQFSSQLEGVRMDLPAPFTKKGTDIQDLSIRFVFPDKGVVPIVAQYSNTLTLNMLVNTDSKKGVIKKGTIQFHDATVSLPDEEQLVIRGSLPAFPVDDWQDILEQDRGDQGKPLLDTLGAPVVLDMNSLHLLTRDDDSEGEAADPHKAALINGRISDLKINDMGLGSFVISTARHPEGISIRKLQVNSGYMNITGEGSWYIRNNRQQTNLLLSVTSENLGTMLSKLGYSAIIENGKTRAIMQANWYDSPDRFSMAKLNGTLGVVIDDGVIRDVKPGAGRLLGLLSLSQLHRRLALDFSELGQGLKFKQIYGQFDIENGDAHTDNLSVVSPIALIGIKGRTGLATRDFDQYVSVVPNVSGSLPVISWLLGGGQIGAFTFILDQLFGDEMDKNVATTNYRVSGTWEEPVITRMKPDNPNQPLDE